MENKGIFNILTWLLGNSKDKTNNNTDNLTDLSLLKKGTPIDNPINVPSKNSAILAPLPPLNEKMLKTMTEHDLFVKRVYKNNQPPTV